MSMVMQIPHAGSGEQQLHCGSEALRWFDVAEYVIVSPDFGLGHQLWTLKGVED